jgi:hypothetical protein
VTTVDLIAIGLLALQAGFVLMMIVYLISGLDDLFFDPLFFADKIAGRFAGNFDRRPASLEEMAEKPEQPFAPMFPAWQEAAVAGALLRIQATRFTSIPMEYATKMQYNSRQPRACGS